MKAGFILVGAGKQRTSYWYPAPEDLVVVMVWLLLIPVNGQCGINEHTDGQGFLHLA